MTLENNFFQHGKLAGQKVAMPSGDYSMSNLDYAVRPTGAGTVTLPPVAEAAGRIHSVVIRTAIAVTITNKGDSEFWVDIALTATDDNAVLYSDGMKWLVLAVTAT